MRLSRISISLDSHHHHHQRRRHRHQTTFASRTRSASRDSFVRVPVCRIRALARLLSSHVYTRTCIRAYAHAAYACARVPRDAIGCRCGCCSADPAPWLARVSRMPPANGSPIHKAAKLIYARARVRVNKQAHGYRPIQGRGGREQSQSSRVFPSAQTFRVSSNILISISPSASKKQKKKTARLIDSRSSSEISETKDSRARPISGRSCCCCPVRYR